MTSNQFYVPRIGEESSRIFLAGEEHHHLSRVARIRRGDEVRLFDGAGLSCLARVVSIAAERTELVVLHREENVNTGLKLVLAQSLVPSKKMEFILQKTTELGISEFVPLETARSMKSRKSEYDRKAQRWAKIARQAVKQSKGSLLPAVRNPVSLAAFLERENEEKRIFLSERTGSLMKNLIMEPLDVRAKPPESAVVVIGPEGGWTEEEEEAFRKHGYEASSLGSRILRTETAALTAVAMMIHFWSH